MNVNHIILNFIKAREKKGLIKLLLISCILSFNIYGQSISQPVLDGTLRCATSIERSVSNVTASLTSTGNFNASVFQLELSNSSGLFNNATVIIEDAEAEIIGQEINFNDFLLPDEDGSGNALASENYRLRIITSDGSISNSSPSAPFGAYFAEIIRPGLEPSGAPNGVLCSIPEFLTAQEDFESYVWFRNGVVIEGENSNILPISQIGEYSYFPDLGECIGNLEDARSNVVTILEADEIAVSISIDGTTSLCASENRVLSATINDNSIDVNNISFNWTLDDIRIPGATESTFVVTGIEAEGRYNVQVFDNSLLAGDRCSSTSNGIEVELLNPSIEIISDLTVFLLPNVDEILEVETSGENQVITWFRDGVAVANSNTNSLLVTEPGTYTASLEATSPCDDNGPFTTEDSIVVAEPSNISLLIDYDNPDYEDCEFDQIILEVIDVTFETATEEVTIPQQNYGALNFEWFRNSESVNEFEESILIDSPEDSGDYFVRITFGGLSFDSDPLPVQLNAGALQIQRSSQDFVFGSSIDLFVGLDDDAIISDFAFRWFFNGQELEGETSPVLTIVNSGSYSVEVTYQDCAPNLIGPIIITSGSTVIPNAITPNGDGINDDWVLTNEFSNQENVEINIFTSSGDLDFSSTNYNGQWPEESESNGIGTIYYFIINREGSAVEKGSITIIR